MKRVSLGDKIFYIVNDIFMMIMIVACLYPMLYVLFASLSEADKLMQFSGALLKPMGFSLEAYKAVLSNSMIWTSYGNTLIHVGLGTLFAMIMTICLMASALCVTTFAADEPATGVVMTVSGLTKDGPVKIEDYTSFEAGWNFAMEKAKDSKYLDNNQYDRIVVDLHDNWKANAKGEFGDDDGVGFPEYTIYIPEKARVMLNMNGHTIDRGLGDRNQFDGEVIYIDEKSRCDYQRWQERRSDRKSRRYRCYCAVWHHHRRQ